MEGGAVALELTFREATPAANLAPTRRRSSKSGSPKPRTGWYSKKSRARGSGQGSAKGSTAAGWASTDADQHALRWHPIGSDEVPAFETCVLLPWLGGGVAALGGYGPRPAGGNRWTEIGVYPPGDERRLREALLLGFQPAEGGGYVVALLVKAAPGGGGVSVVELCRAPLGVGQQPVSFNLEKTPPGAHGRASAEAVCEDGRVRRWCIAPALPRGDDDERETSFALSTVDLCCPFGASTGGEEGPGDGGSKTVSPAPLLAVASANLLAVARSIERPRKPQRALTPARSFRESSVRSEEELAAETTEPPASIEVWSCSDTPYPLRRFKKDGTVALPGIQAVEGMCWVSPEAGDERGAAVSGHCLCVSVAGSVTVLARERSSHAVLPGLEGAGGEEGWVWSPVFRVASPSSLLACRTAGLRDFCQVRNGGVLLFLHVCVCVHGIVPTVLSCVFSSEKGLAVHSFFNGYCEESVRGLAEFVVLTTSSVQVTRCNGTRCRFKPPAMTYKIRTTKKFTLVLPGLLCLPHSLAKPRVMNPGSSLGYRFFFVFVCHICPGSQTPHPRYPPSAGTHGQVPTQPRPVPGPHPRCETAAAGRGDGGHGHGRRRGAEPGDGCH